MELNRTPRGRVWFISEFIRSCGGISRSSRREACVRNGVEELLLLGERLFHVFQNKSCMDEVIKSKKPSMKESGRTSGENFLSQNCN